MDRYLIRIASDGRLTLPKRLRGALGLQRSDRVVLIPLGDAVILRRFRKEDKSLEAIRRKVRKSGLTRVRLKVLLDEVKEETWNERYGEARR
ncbi:MAG: AbrB/MazE/SpoVT family DNA-binding domain-containing protein [Thermoplasmata archaeon]